MAAAQARMHARTAALIASCCLESSSLPAALPPACALFWGVVGWEAADAKSSAAAAALGEPEPPAGDPGAAAGRPAAAESCTGATTRTFCGLWAACCAARAASAWRLASLSSRN